MSTMVTKSIPVSINAGAVLSTARPTGGGACPTAGTAIVHITTAVIGESPTDRHSYDNEQSGKGYQ